MGDIAMDAMDVPPIREIATGAGTYRRTRALAACAAKRGTPFRAHPVVAAAPTAAAAASVGNRIALRRDRLLGRNGDVDPAPAEPGQGNETDDKQGRRSRLHGRDREGPAGSATSDQDLVVVDAVGRTGRKEINGDSGPLTATVKPNTSSRGDVGYSALSLPPSPPVASNPVIVSSPLDALW